MNIDELAECPHCQHDLEVALDKIFRAHDYPTEFNMICPQCKEKFGVEVRPVPEFWTSKKPTQFDETYEVLE